MARRFFLAFFLVSVLIVPVSGQVRKLTSEDIPAFSSDSVLFRFSSGKFPLEGARVNDLLSKWGVIFAGTGSTVQRIKVRITFLFDVLTRDMTGALVNETLTGSSENQPLIVTFKNPSRRVLFRLAGDQSTTVTLKAFDPVGADLGTITHLGLSGGDSVGTLLGIETTAALGMAKIVIDYGGSTVPEQVEELRLDFIARPRFNTFLAQVGDGTAGDLKLQTVIAIANAGTNPVAKGSLKVFDSSGNPLSSKIDGVSASEFSFELPPGASKTLTTAGDGPLKAGYAKIESSAPLEATAVFRTLAGSTGALISETGVGSAMGKITLVGTVQRFLQTKVDSGIALVNTSSTATTVEVSIAEEGGGLVTPKAKLDLGPGQHRARFLPDLFPELSSRDFKGSIVIASVEPIAVVILRTVNGLAASSLPLASTEAN